MRWFPLVLLFLLAWIELTLFNKVASVLGVFSSLLLIIFTSFIGLSLIRNKGINTLKHLRNKLILGENPTSELVSSVSIFIAGLLLIIPGFFTDFIALLLLLPPIQHFLTLRLISLFRINKTTSQYQHTSYEATTHSHRTIDGEYKRKDEE